MPPTTPRAAPRWCATKERRDTAAIASERAGSLFGLEALKSGVEDFKDNITRFLAVGRERVPLGTPDKTSVVFTLKSEPGALFKALSVFALRGIDLSKLESRPVPGRPWEYLFYVDVAAAREDLSCTRAMVHLAEFAASLRTLGSYPRWREPEPVTAGATRRRAGADAQGARPWLTRRSATAEVAERRASRTARAGRRRARCCAPSASPPRIWRVRSSASPTPGSRSARAISTCASWRTSVKAGIRAAGGTPMEFNTVSISDGITMGSRRHARLARQP